MKTQKFTQYTIAGKSKKDGNYYLVFLAGNKDEHAQMFLEKAKNDEKLKSEYDDFIIEKHEEKRWWNE